MTHNCASRSVQCCAMLCNAVQCCAMLCNASIAVSTELFGDLVGKETDEVVKANRLGEKAGCRIKTIVFLVTNLM